MSTRHTVIDTALLGPVTIVAADAVLTGVYFRHHIRRPAQELFGPLVFFVDDTVLGEAVGQLLEYLLGQRRDFDLPFNPLGDEFQRKSMATGQRDRVRYDRHLRADRAASG